MKIQKMVPAKIAGLTYAIDVVSLEDHNKEVEKFKKDIRALEHYQRLSDQKDDMIQNLRKQIADLIDVYDAKIDEALKERKKLLQVIANLKR